MAKITNTFQEISKSSITLNKFEETLIAWCKSYIAVRVERTIRIIELSYNLSSTSKKINFDEFSIKVSLTSPATGLFDYTKRGVYGLDLVQMIMDPALWPHSENMLQEVTDIIAFQWSPEHVTWNNEHILAVLNSVGHVEFYRKAKREWVSDLELSTLVKEKFDATVNCKPTDLESLTHAAYTLVSCSMSWAPVVNDNKVFFVTAQKDGTFIFWLIKEELRKIEAECYGYVNTDLVDIDNIVWLSKSSQVLLLCSNVFGQILLLEFSLNENNVQLSKCHTLWANKDKMIVRSFSYTFIEDKLIYFCNKHRHLLCQMLSDDYEILSQYLNNINDYRIMGISQKADIFYVITANECLYKINYEVEDDNIVIDLDLLTLNDLCSTSELHGIDFSINGVMLALCVIDRKVLIRKERTKLDVVLLSLGSDSLELDYLFNNQTKKLSHYWDCIELLRYKVMKTKQLPDIDYCQLLLEGKYDTYKLKLYLIILTFCKALQNNFKIPSGVLPEESMEIVKEKIMVAHAYTFLYGLHEKYLDNNKTLNSFQAECFNGCKKFLEYYNRKYEQELNIPEKVWNIIGDDFSYVCQGCDKKLLNYSCEDEHVNMFCSISFTPIEGIDYLACRGCGVTARYEFFTEKPMCIFCDLNFTCV